mmetsp:Transcript_41415/g.63189  ORF Transcript_41415/g.63189 Transcript_41415/m.63189 type:complete len:86 (-) Transcript_41415:1420-1677(-)
MYSRALIAGELPDPADGYDNEEDDDEPESPTILDNFLNPHSPEVYGKKSEHNLGEEMKHEETEADEEEKLEPPPEENPDNRAFRA